MNIDNVKENIREILGNNVIITVKGSRNRKEIYEGVLYRMYPNIFSIKYKNMEKSFSYADVATKDIVLKVK